MDTIEAVRAIFDNVQYRRFRCNKKTHGYVSPNGHVVYLSQVQTKPPWRVAIDPREPRSALISNGIFVLDSWYHGSNMVEFPRRKHNGQRDIPYAWRLIVREPGALQRILRAVDQLPAQLPLEVIPCDSC